MNTKKGLNMAKNGTTSYLGSGEITNTFESGNWVVGRILMVFENNITNIVLSKEKKDVFQGV